MQIECKGFVLQLITLDHSENYFNLIEKNRTQLVE